MCVPVCGRFNDGLTMKFSAMLTCLCVCVCFWLWNVVQLYFRAANLTTKKSSGCKKFEQTVHLLVVVVMSDSSASTSSGSTPTEDNRPQLLSHGTKKGHSTTLVSNGSADVRSSAVAAAATMASIGISTTATSDPSPMTTQTPPSNSKFLACSVPSMAFGDVELESVFAAKITRLFQNHVLFCTCTLLTMLSAMAFQSSGITPLSQYCRIAAVVIWAIGFLLFGSLHVILRMELRFLRESRRSAHLENDEYQHMVATVNDDHAALHQPIHDMLQLQFAKRWFTVSSNAHDAAVLILLQGGVWVSLIATFAETPHGDQNTAARYQFNGAYVLIEQLLLVALGIQKWRMCVVGYLGTIALYIFLNATQVVPHSAFRSVQFAPSILYLAFHALLSVMTAFHVESSERKTFLVQLKLEDQARQLREHSRIAHQTALQKIPQHILTFLKNPQRTVVAPNNAALYVPATNPARERVQPIQSKAYIVLVQFSDALMCKLFGSARHSGGQYGPCDLVKFLISATSCFESAVIQHVPEPWVATRINAPGHHLAYAFSRTQQPGLSSGDAVVPIVSSLQNLLDCGVSSLIEWCEEFVAGEQLEHSPTAQSADGGCKREIPGESFVNVKQRWMDVCIEYLPRVGAVVARESISGSNALATLIVGDEDYGVSNDTAPFRLGQRTPQTSSSNRSPSHHPSILSFRSDSDVPPAQQPSVPSGHPLLSIVEPDIWTRTTGIWRLFGAFASPETELKFRSVFCLVSASNQRPNRLEMGSQNSIKSLVLTQATFMIIYCACHFFTILIDPDIHEMPAMGTTNPSSVVDNPLLYASLAALGAVSLFLPLVATTVMSDLYVSSSNTVVERQLLRLLGSPVFTELCYWVFSFFFVITAFCNTSKRTLLGAWITPFAMLALSTTVRRPLWFSPAVMWLLDAILAVVIVIRAWIFSNTVTMFIGVLYFIVAMAWRIVLEDSEATRFAEHHRVIEMKKLISQSTRQTLTELLNLVPMEVAQEILLTRVEKERNYANRRSNSCMSMARNHGMLSGALAALHPFRSTVLSTVTQERCVALVELAPRSCFNSVRDAARFDTIVTEVVRHTLSALSHKGHSSAFGLLENAGGIRVLFAKRYGDVLMLSSSDAKHEVTRGTEIAACFFAVQRIVEALTGSSAAFRWRAWMDWGPTVGALVGEYCPTFEWYSPKLLLGHAALAPRPLGVDHDLWIENSTIVMTEVSAEGLLASSDRSIAKLLQSGPFSFVRQRCPAVWNIAKQKVRVYPLSVANSSRWFVNDSNNT